MNNNKLLNNSLLQDNNVSTNVPPLQTYEQIAKEEKQSVSALGYEQQSFVPCYTDEEREKIKLRLDKFLQAECIDVENPIEPSECLIEVNGVPALPFGDLSLITGEKKNGKSTTYQVLCSVLLGEEGRWGPIVRTAKDPHVVIFDSEQARYHAQQATMRILRMAGLPPKNIYDRLRYVPMRLLTYEGRQQVIADYLETYRPNVVVIDGIVDLISDFNSIDESKPLVDKLMAWATQYQCCIIGLIHTSKTNPDEPRGHLGAFGVEKAYMTIEVKKDQLGIFTVGTQSSRGEEMPEWHFKHDADDIVPADDDVEIHRKKSNDQRRDTMIKKGEEQYRKNACMVTDLIKKAGGSIKKSDLVKLIEETDGLGQKTTAAYRLISHMENDKIITYDVKGCIAIASE